MNYPNKTQQIIVGRIRKMPLWRVFIYLVCCYFLINIFFSLIGYCFKIIDSDRYIDYLYFYFVTNTTIGFGDFFPISDIGKILIIFQSIITIIYFSLMVSVIFLKLLYPNKTIYFSKIILFTDKFETFSFRIINTHYSKFINPDIRVEVTLHGEEDSYSLSYLVKKIDGLCSLGHHDTQIHVPNDFQTPYGSLKISDEVREAREYQIDNKKSNFRLSISISGNYDFQSYMDCTEYSVEQVQDGYVFEEINYDEEYIKKYGTVNFQKIPKFWKKFNKPSKLIIKKNG